MRPVNEQWLQDQIENSPRVTDLQADVDRLQTELRLFKIGMVLLELLSLALIVALLWVNYS